MKKSASIPIPASLVAEVAASRAVESLPDALIDAGVDPKSANAVSKAVKEYLTSAPGSENRVLNELANAGIGKEEASSLFRSFEDALK